ncbi:MAG: glycoside hydrolase family 36 protein [Termitinemataceae bacterium]
MDIHGISKTKQPLPQQTRGVRCTYSVSESSLHQTVPGLVIDALAFEELAHELSAPASFMKALQQPQKLAIHPGGWQSWSAGWELVGNERLPTKVHVIPELLKFTNRDGDNPQKDIILGHFITYIRNGSTYLCLASREGGSLPPVTYRIHRKSRRITLEVFAENKIWQPGETMAEIYMFIAEDYFTLKDILRSLYHNDEQFAKLAFLRSNAPVASPWISKADMPGGFESWYNHYTHINEDLILDDLESLGTTDNLIKLQFINKKRPTVFQIDDGWEQAVGHWEIDTAKFPHGLKPLADKIEHNGYIPGLWLAPFLVTRKSPVFTEHPEWVLKDSQGELVVAGYNDLWDKQFYCLDLSHPEVQQYLQTMIERAIDEWGFRYLKLDFLYAGLLHGAFYAGGAAYEHYERACTLLTKRTHTKDQKPVAYLGCGVPFGPSYKHFPLSRIGADTKEQWDWLKVRIVGHVGRPAAYVSLHDTIGRSYLDNTVYVSDPDVVFLRTANCQLTETEKETVALTNFLLASQIMFSDDPSHLEEADITLTRRISRLYDELCGEEYGVERIQRDVFHVFSRSGKIQGIINLSGTAVQVRKQEAKSFFDIKAEGNFLINHLLKNGDAVIRCETHSITLCKG